jgi:hypothetical protein
MLTAVAGLTLYERGQRIRTATRRGSGNGRGCDVERVDGDVRGDMENAHQRVGTRRSACSGQPDGTSTT